MKYLLLAAVLAGCNYGLVDIQEKERPCDSHTYHMGRDSVTTDTIPKTCGTTKVTTPFDLPDWGK